LSLTRVSVKKTQESYHGQVKLHLLLLEPGTQIANTDQGNINASQKKNKEGKQDNQADKKKGQDDALESGARQGNRQQDSKLSSQQR